MAIYIGIDLGSVSVKAALLSRDPGDAQFFQKYSTHPLFQSVKHVKTPASGDCWLAVTQYARIAGNPLQQTRGLLERLVEIVGPVGIAEVAGTGRGAKLLSSEFRLCAQNEFRALSKAVETAPSVPETVPAAGRASG